MEIARSRTFRLSMFALIYFAQGAGLAYFRNFQKPYLDGLGVDPDIIGLLTTILLLPFILKIFIGMLSDRVNLFGEGHRKPYMVVGLILAALSFGAAGFILPDANFTLFAVLIVCGSFSVTIFDSTADGLAIDTTPEKEQGTVQGVMVGGRVAGFIILSLVFGALVSGQGFRIVFLIIAGMMLLPLLWVWRVREPVERVQEQAFHWGAFKSMGKPLFLLFGIYAVVYSIASFGVDGLVTYYMSSDSIGASDAAIGQYGALRGLGAVLGALTAAAIIDRLGQKISALAALVLITLGAAVIGLMETVPSLLAVGLVWGIFWAFQETIFVALAMRLADVRIAASMFAIMMAVSNLGTAVGEGLATGLTDNLSFQGVFWLLAGINLLNVPILLGFFKYLTRSQEK